MVLYSLSWLSNEVEIVWNSAGIQMTCHRRKVMSLKPDMGKFVDAEGFSKTLTPRSLEFPAASVTLCSLAQRKRMFAAGGGSRLGEALRLEASTNWAQSYDNSYGIWLEKIFGICFRMVWVCMKNWGIPKKYQTKTTCLLPK